MMIDVILFLILLTLALFIACLFFHSNLIKNSINKIETLIDKLSYKL